jgi:hypothetical protein
VFGVASTPTRPLAVIAAAISACGSTTGTTATPSSLATPRATSAPTEVAVLQAITSSFAPRPSRSEEIRAIRSRKRSVSRVP